MGKPIVITDHAREQMDERGASEEEVRIAVQQGEEEPARAGRVMVRKNFEFNREWRGKHYRIKQVAPVLARDDDTLIIVTVYVFYF